MFEHTGVSRLGLFPLENILRLYFTGITDSLIFGIFDVASNSLCYLKQAEQHPELYRFFEDSQGYLVIMPKEGK